MIADTCRYNSNAEQEASVEVEMEDPEMSEARMYSAADPEAKFYI